jgi:hypothetical protein
MVGKLVKFGSANIHAKPVDTSLMRNTGNCALKNALYQIARPRLVADLQLEPLSPPFLVELGGQLILVLIVHQSLPPPVQNVVDNFTDDISVATPLEPYNEPT